MSQYQVGSEEWLEALDYPEQARSEIKSNREKALKAGILNKPNDSTKALDRKAALEAIELEFGEWTYLDSTTVLAGGVQHKVPRGTVIESAPSIGTRGPKGGRYLLTRSGKKTYKIF